jgi:hypothetical protein
MTEQVPAVIDRAARRCFRGDLHVTSENHCPVGTISYDL